jgi:hypothetical protein
MLKHLKILDGEIVMKDKIRVLETIAADILISVLSEEKE